MKILRRSISVIDIGEMRDIVIMKPPTITTGERNNKVLTYPEADWINVYALVHPGGNERSLQEANLTYDNIVTIYIRWNSNLSSDWKVSYDGFDYTIHKSSNVDAKKRFIELLCYAKTG